MKNCIYISKSQKEHDEVEKRKQEYLTQCIREMEQGVFLCLNGICLNDREIQKIFTILDKEWNQKLIDKIQKMTKEWAKTHKTVVRNTYFDRLPIAYEDNTEYYEGD